MRTKKIIPDYKIKVTKETFRKNRGFRGGG